MDIFIIGAGGGNASTYTQEALSALQEAQVILGAKRLLAGVPAMNSDAKLWEAARPSEVCDVLARLKSENSGVRVVILQSGDTGFHSGCRFLVGKMKDLFGPLSDEVRNLRILPGISSVQMLAARLQEPWQDWLLVSGHGVSCDVLQYLMQGKKIFMLTGGDLTPDVICSQLVQAGLGDLGVYVASDLSCGDRMYVEKCADQRTAAETLETCGGGADSTDIAGETICRGTASDFAHRKFPIMSVMLIDAVPVWRGYAAGIPDAEFIRGKVPMTKQEVRSVILAKLAPCRDDVVWDVGAGTGSVSIELAHHAGQVWAFERNREAVELICANRRKLCAWNLRVVQGAAPEVFCENAPGAHRNPEDIWKGQPSQCAFPAPDKVFIGGSSGNLSGIVRYIAGMGAGVRICVSAVLLETLHETMYVFDELGFETDVVQVAVTRTERVAGRYMMKACNPVWIITGSSTSEKQ